MTSHRRIKGVYVVAVLATAKVASAQEPWVAPAPTPAPGSEVVAAPMIAEPPVHPAEPTSDVGTRSSSMLDHYMAPVRRAVEVELGIGGGLPLGAGFGEFNGTATSPKMRDVANAGGAVQLTIGYRLNRHWMFGAYGSGARYGKRDVGDATDSKIWAANAGLLAEYHFRPTYALDPFVSLASGWSGFWVTPKNLPDISVQGWQMARVNVGIDFRMTRGFALAPMIGGDATLFLTKNDATTNGFDNITPRVNFFLFAGLQGRFDFGPRPQAAPAMAKSDEDDTATF
jgi:hypothetical protein